MKTCLVLVGGIPGAGKTYFSQCVKKLLDESQLATVLLSYDDVLSVQEQKAVVEDKKEIRHLRQKIVSFVECYVSGIDFDQRCCDKECCQLSFPFNLPEQATYIIIDDNFYYQSMRYEYYQLAKKYDLGFCQFFLSCSVDLALKQNADRAGDLALPESVIVDMASKLEMPDPMKNVWEQFSFVLPVTSYHQEHQLEVVLEMMKMASNFPVVEEDISAKLAMAENDRKLCSASVVHQADKVLRKIVNSKVKEHRDANIGEDIKMYCRALNETRNKILEDMKCGVLLIDETLKGKVEGRASDAISGLEAWLKEVFEIEHLQC